MFGVAVMGNLKFMATGRRAPKPRVRPCKCALRPPVRKPRERVLEKLRELEEVVAYLRKGLSARDRR